MRELFLGLDLDLLDAALLFAYMVPSFLIIVLPISCMVSVFLSCLRLSSDRELIALKAGGVSIYQLLFSPAIFSFLCMLLCLFISVYGSSWGMSNFRSLVLQIASTRAKVVVQPGVFNQDIIEGVTLFARKVDPETGKMSEVLFEDNTQNEDSSATVIAPSGDIVTDESQGKIIFKLLNGKIYRIDKNDVSVLDFEEYLINIDLSLLVSGVDLGDVKPKEMSWPVLLSLTPGETKNSLKTYNKALVEVQKRLALPVSCLILGIFALPLACLFEGVKQQMGVFFSMLMFLIYYSLFSLGMSLGEAGTLSPVIALWSSNVLFAIAALLGLYFTANEKLFSFDATHTKHAIFSFFKGKKA